MSSNDMNPVRLFDGEDVIGMVEYTDNLDFWDGRNYCRRRCKNVPETAE